jgi:hypothetical protein
MLDSDECITTISLGQPYFAESQGRFTKITMGTNKSRTFISYNSDAITCGEDVIAQPSGPVRCLLAFAGRAGTYLDQLSFYWSDVAPSGESFTIICFILTKCASFHKCTHHSWSSEIRCKNKPVSPLFAYQVGHQQQEARQGGPHICKNKPVFHAYPSIWVISGSIAWLIHCMACSLHGMLTK